MPPKSKFTREEIVAAALGLVSEKGLEALTARELGSRLGSSSRPIFTVFQNMEEVQKEVRAAAMGRFESYAKESSPGISAFQQVGIRMIQFAIEEPNLYQLLFMSENAEAGSLREVLAELSPLTDICIQLICENYDLNQQDARTLFESVWIHTYGIGVLYATGMCQFSEAELQEMMERNFWGTLMIIKAGRQ